MVRAMIIPHTSMLPPSFAYLWNRPPSNRATYLIRPTVSLSFLRFRLGSYTKTNSNANLNRYKNNTVALNWTISDPTSDTYPFRALLSNSDQSLLDGNHSIADSSESTSPTCRTTLSISSGPQVIINPSRLSLHRLPSF